MNYQILSFTSVGPILLGMTAEGARSAVGGEFSSFRKSDDSLMLTDAFLSDAVHVYYDSSGKVEAVELFRPANPLLDGERLIGQPFDRMVAWFRLRDPGIEVDADGLRSPKYGIALYAPAAVKSPKEPVEAVLVFRRGYYST